MVDNSYKVELILQAISVPTSTMTDQQSIIKHTLPQATIIDQHDE